MAKTMDSLPSIAAVRKETQESDSDRPPRGSAPSMDFSAVSDMPRGDPFDNEFHSLLRRVAGEYDKLASRLASVQTEAQRLSAALEESNAALEASKASKPCPASEQIKSLVRDAERGCNASVELPGSLEFAHRPPSPKRERSPKRNIRIAPGGEPPRLPGMLENPESESLAMPSEIPEKVGKKVSLALPNGEATPKADLAASEALSALSTPSSMRKSRTLGTKTFQLTMKTIWDETVEQEDLQAFVDLQDVLGKSQPVHPHAIVESHRHPKLQRWISHPASKHRIVWDLIGAVLIFYDIVSIPLDVFTPPGNTFTTFMDWWALMFWTMNMAASLQVAYIKNGVPVTDPQKIFMNYASTWFLVDLVVVVPDWVFTIIRLQTGGGESGESFKLLRTLRMVRIVRLLRLMKLKKILGNLNDLVDSEYVSIFLSIGKMILCMLAVNHYIACAWFAIGTVSEVSWLTEHNFADSHWVYQYLTAFHFSITQFTPASMHVQPQNIVERTFAIIVVVFALVGFSYVVGSITGSLAQLRSMTEDSSKQFWSLRRYLRNHKVDLQLSVRIQAYLEHMWQRNQVLVSKESIGLFKLLSKQLSSELQCALSRRHFEVHPLLRHLGDVADVTLFRLANAAISQVMLARGEALFYGGEVATHMSFVVAGKLKYVRRLLKTDKDQPAGKPLPEEVDPDEDWIAEACLWVNKWVHVGVLTAMKECEILLVDAVGFGKVVHLNPKSLHVVCSYARNFMNWIIGVEEKDLSDIWQGDSKDVNDRVLEFIGVEHSEQQAGTRIWNSVIGRRSASAITISESESSNM